MDSYESFFGYKQIEQEQKKSPKSTATTRESRAMRFDRIQRRKNLTNGFWEFIKGAGVLIGIILAVLIFLWFDRDIINGEKNECTNAYQYYKLEEIPAYCIKYFK